LFEQDSNTEVVFFPDDRGLVISYLLTRFSSSVDVFWVGNGIVERKFFALGTFEDIPLGVPLLLS